MIGFLNRDRITMESIGIVNDFNQTHPYDDIEGHALSPDIGRPPWAGRL